MADVIDLSRRNETKQRRRQEGRNRRKAEAVASALSCGMCPRKCAFCGQAIEYPEPPLSKVPYPLCDCCRDEAQAFLRYEEGLIDDNTFWQTEQWAHLWRSWLAHMDALGRFRNSREFLKLMQEYTQ